MVDEFHMLIDSMPDAMAELMRIARLAARWAAPGVGDSASPGCYFIGYSRQYCHEHFVCVWRARRIPITALLEHGVCAYISAAHQVPGMCAAG